MDLVQDTLLNVLRGLDHYTYKSEGDFVRWLSRLSENELRRSLKKLRADKRDIRKEFHFDVDHQMMGNAPVIIHEPIDATTLSVIMSRKEDLIKLEKAIDELKTRVQRSDYPHKNRGTVIQEHIEKTLEEQ